MEEKLTPHRQAVLEIVRAAKDHPSAREVYERSARHSPKLSFATVYNALKFLTEQGHLRQIRFGEDAVRYDPILDRHDHLVCRLCGRVDDAFGGEPPAVPGSLKSLNGFQVEEITVQFLGVCQACRKPGRPVPTPSSPSSPQKPKRR